MTAADDSAAGYTREQLEVIAERAVLDLINAELVDRRRLFRGWLDQLSPEEVVEASVTMAMVAIGYLDGLAAGDLRLRFKLDQALAIRDAGLPDLPTTFSPPS